MTRNSLNVPAHLSNHMRKHEPKNENQRALREANYAHHKTKGKLEPITEAREKRLEGRAAELQSEIHLLHLAFLDEWRRLHTEREHIVRIQKLIEREQNVFENAWAKRFQPHQMTPHEIETLKTEMHAVFERCKAEVSEAKRARHLIDKDISKELREFHHSHELRVIMGIKGYNFQRFITKDKAISKAVRRSENELSRGINKEEVTLDRLFATLLSSADSGYQEGKASRPGSETMNPLHAVNLGLQFIKRSLDGIISKIDDEMNRIRPSLNLTFTLDKRRNAMHSQTFIDRYGKPKAG